MIDSSDSMLADEAAIRKHADRRDNLEVALGQASPLLPQVSHL